MSLFAEILSLFRPQTKYLAIDLRTFECGHTRLGFPPDDRDFFAQRLRKSDVCNLVAEGFEVGTKDGCLDSLFISLLWFRGTFLYRGARVPLSPLTTTPDQIQRHFGTPYWIDSDDDEIILFYEFDDGRVELQFEFPGKKRLRYITLMRDGVLSIEAQRKAYRVTRPWPPGADESGPND